MEEFLEQRNLESEAKNDLDLNGKVVGVNGQILQTDLQNARAFGHKCPGRYNCKKPGRQVFTESRA